MLCIHLGRGVNPRNDKEHIKPDDYSLFLSYVKFQFLKIYLRPMPVFSVLLFSVLVSFCLLFCSVDLKRLFLERTVDTFLRLPDSVTDSGNELRKRKKLHLWLVIFNCRLQTCTGNGSAKDWVTNSHSKLKSNIFYVRKDILTLAGYLPCFFDEIHHF